MCSQREFTKWMLWFQRNPWGEERADLRMGILASVMANIWTGKKGAGFKAADFMPKFGPARRQTPEEMRARLLSLVGKRGGAKRGRRK